MENENQLQVFTNEEFGEVRTIIKEEETWFIAKDIASILGYSETSAMTRRQVDEDDLSKWQTVDEIGKTNTFTMINESGLYSAILGSKRTEAKKFKKWITSEVLPSIRKHGAYMTDETIEKALLNPDFLIKLATELKEEKLKRIEAERKIEESKPLITFAETCIKSKDNILVRQLSKIANDEGIDIGEKRLYKKLREWKLIMGSSTEPYQYGMDREWFVVEEKSVNTPYCVKLTKVTTVTPKGQVYIIEKLKKELNNN